jgi:hypothetical protein
MPGADPYRDASGQRCPRCRGVLSDDGNALTCAGGCGEWLQHGRMEIPRDAFDQRSDDDGAVWWIAGPGRGAACPQCGVAMMCFGTLYEYCPSHGAWVDARQRNNFRAHFATAIQRAGRVAQILAEAAIDPAALAARIAKLEHEVRWLRARLEELERR